MGHGGGHDLEAALTFVAESPKGREMSTLTEDAATAVRDWRGQYRTVQPAVGQADLATVAQHMFALMLRNVSSDGFAFADPADPSQFSRPGCIIASPSYHASYPAVDQDYVFNWTRDAAIVAIELAAAELPTNQPLIDYVNFAQTCQNSGPPIGWASYTIEGRKRDGWSEQSDGPALRTLAILQLYPQLDAATQAVARAVIATDIGYLLAVYQQPTKSLWEERDGFSFFARSVQSRCFSALANNALGIPVPAEIAEAISWLQARLAEHWNSNENIYVTFGGPAGASNPPLTAGYDPNVDIVMACIYGAIEPTDTRMLATAARIRSQWTDPASSFAYPINAADAGAPARAADGPLPRRSLRRRRRPADRQSATPGCRVPPTSPSSTTGSRLRPATSRPCPSTTGPPRSSARSESTIRPRLGRPQTCSTRPETGCCRR